MLFVVTALNSNYVTWEILIHCSVPLYSVICSYSIKLELCDMENLNYVTQKIAIHSVEYYLYNFIVVIALNLNYVTWKIAIHSVEYHLYNFM